MQTNFSLVALAESHMRESEKILRACVHCGFCTATCPTYLLLGDELDSPRGRIYLIKDMFENEKPASEKVVKHIDRCLSCLSCMTTCPSGVHYMHLVDHARAHITETYKRPLIDRVLRSALAAVLPNPKWLRPALFAASVVRPIKKWLVRLPGGTQLGAMIDLAPALRPRKHAPPELNEGNRRGRVAILTGCAQQVIAPGINDAAIRLLRRHGIEVTSPRGEGCCGALVHHMGYEDSALDAARRNVDVWTRELDENGLDAIIVTASGC